MSTYRDPVPPFFADLFRAYPVLATALGNSGRFSRMGRRRSPLFAGSSSPETGHGPGRDGTDSRGAAVGGRVS